MEEESICATCLNALGCHKHGEGNAPQVGGSGGKEKRMLLLSSSCVESSDTKLPIMTHDEWEPSHHLGCVLNVCQWPLLLAINLAFGPTAVWS